MAVTFFVYTWSRLSLPILKIHLCVQTGSVFIGAFMEFIGEENLVVSFASVLSNGISLKSFDLGFIMTVLLDNFIFRGRFWIVYDEN